MRRVSLRTHQLTVAVDEADCLGNVVQAHGHILLPALHTILACWQMSTLKLDIQGVS